MPRQVFHDKSLTLFIAAFEPFGGRDCNTSADLLHALKSSGLPPGIQLAGDAVLPVDFATAWKRLGPEIRQTKPDLLLLMGEKKGGYLTLERFAHNKRRDGNSQAEILSGKPKRLNTRAKLDQIFEMLRQLGQNRFRPGKYAGDYLCNYIYFMALMSEPELPALFLHVPARTANQFSATKNAWLNAMHDLLSAWAAYPGSIGDVRDRIKAIDGAATNDMPREN